MAEAIIRNLNGLEFSSLLEVGCGYGLCLNLIGKNIPGKRLVGVDISRTMIQNAVKYLGRKVPLIVSNAFNLPFKNSEFDVAFTNVCLVHIPPENIEETIIEILRVASKGFFVETSVKVNQGLRRIPLNGPYYFTHNFPEIFRSLGLEYSILETIDPKVERRIYLVGQHA